MGRLVDYYTPYMDKQDLYLPSLLNNEAVVYQTHISYEPTSEIAYLPPDALNN